MYVSLDELQKINKIQIEILKEVAAVCKKINVTFFAVHGSLLGAIRNGKFIPYDDDIDIAMRRADYEKFLNEAPNLLDKALFVQSNVSDKNYPLQFAKVRDCRTTYICEAVKKLDMNHGIYIDIFPIDYTREKVSIAEELKLKLLSTRISASLYRPNATKLQKIKGLVSCLMIPSLNKAIKERERIYKSTLSSDWVRMTGGKLAENRMPKKWFDDAEKKSFEGIEVYIPEEYDAYLNCIYGNYGTRTLVEEKMKGDMVELNATVIDTGRPYTYYFK